MCLGDGSEFKIQLTGEADMCSIGRVGHSRAFVSLHVPPLNAHKIHVLCANMSFRADAQAQLGRERAIQKFITRHLGDERIRSEEKLNDLIDRYGPVVNAYPHWHPIVASAPGAKKERKPFPVTLPGHEAGYEGLDHTIYLRDAFITCPYGGEEQIFESVDALEDSKVASIRAERIDFPLYMPNATPVIVRCKWNKPLESDGTIPKSIAVPLLLEMELPNWRTSDVAETWETMRPYILGEPRGARSSLFVNQETGQVLKDVWNTLIYTGMFGPI